MCLLGGKRPEAGGGHSKVSIQASFFSTKFSCREFTRTDENDSVGIQRPLTMASPSQRLRTSNKGTVNVAVARHRDDILRIPTQVFSFVHRFRVKHEMIIPAWDESHFGSGTIYAIMSA